MQVTEISLNHDSTKESDNHMEWGWCLGRNPSFVLSSIQLSGLPAPSCRSHRRLFALALRWSAVSPIPQVSSISYHISSSNDQWTFRFCSGARVLTLRLTTSRFCRVDGVSSAPLQGTVSCSPIHQPSQWNYSESSINLSKNSHPSSRFSFSSIL